MAVDFQFVGVNEILAAYESRGVDRWALFAGKRLITQGDGLEPLRSFLAMVARSNSIAVYTLKVFEDLPETEKVKSNTPDDGSFNFKLSSFDGVGSLSGIVGTHYGDPVQQKILERLEAIEAAQTPEPEDEGVIGQITKAFIGMLEEPHKLHDFIGALQGGSGQPQHQMRNPYLPPVNSVGSVTRVQATQAPDQDPEVITEENAERIANVIKKLGRYDPKFLDHLEALAGIAEKTPNKFKTLISLLDAGL